MAHPHIGWRLRFVIQRRKAQSVVVNKTCCGAVTDRNNCCYVPQAGKRLKRFGKPSFDAPDIQRWVPIIPVPYTEADARRFILMTLQAWHDGTSAELLTP